MESKIHIKMGPVEVDCEASEAFIKTELLGLVEKLAGFYKSNNIPEEAKAGKNPSGSGPPLKLSTGSIAAKLGCKKGPDLVVAAAAHFALSRARDTFTRQELLDEMKTASAFYKKSYSGNLTSHLNGLVKAGKLNEPATGTYSLISAARRDLENRLVKSS